MANDIFWDLLDIFLIIYLDVLPNPRVQLLKENALNMLEVCQVLQPLKELTHK